MLAGPTQPCQNNAPPPPFGALLLLIDVLYVAKLHLLRCIPPPPMPQAVLLSIEQPTSDSEEELLAEIAPPIASDEQDSKRVWITCAETGAPETDMAPPSAVDLHREKSVDDTSMSSLLPTDEGELAKTAPPAPPAPENQSKI
jgi:hypothetical protein